MGYNNELKKIKKKKRKENEAEEWTRLYQNF